MNKIYQRIVIILAIVCIYLTWNTNKIGEQVMKLNTQMDQVHKMFGRGATYYVKSDMTYVFKVRIDRKNEKPLEIPLFQIQSPQQGQERKDQSITFFRLQTPKNKWTYRIHVEGKGLYNVRSWGSMEHIEEKYGLNEFEIERILHFFRTNDYGEKKIVGNQELGSIGITGNDTDTKITLMVEVFDGSIIFANEEAHGIFM